MGKRPRTSRSLPIAETAIGREADILILESFLVHGHFKPFPTIIGYILTLHHGGCIQAAEAELAELAARKATRKAPPIETSRLGEMLLNEVLWGFMAASVAQRLAAAAVQDGCTHADLRSLAAVGGDGTHPKNSWRDLERKMAPNKLQAAYTFVRNLTPSRHCRPQVHDHLNCSR